MFVEHANQRGVRELLKALKPLLPKEDYNTALDFLDHNEWGLAFEHVCTQLYEYDVSISQTVYNHINQLGSNMKLQESEWIMLKELVR